MSDKNNTWTTRETADFLNVHTETVRRLARRRDIPAFKVGRDWRFHEEVIRRWAKTHHLRSDSVFALLIFLP